MYQCIGSLATSGSHQSQLRDAHFSAGPSEWSIRSINCTSCSSCASTISVGREHRPQDVDTMSHVKPSHSHPPLGPEHAPSPEHVRGITAPLYGTSVLASVSSCASQIANRGRCALLDAHDLTAVRSLYETARYIIRPRSTCNAEMLKNGPLVPALHLERSTDGRLFVASLFMESTDTS